MLLQRVEEEKEMNEEVEQQSTTHAANGRLFSQSRPPADA